VPSPIYSRITHKKPHENKYSVQRNKGGLHRVRVLAFPKQSMEFDLRKLIAIRSAAKESVT
jgi:hypothetical protein